MVPRSSGSYSGLWRNRDYGCILSGFLVVICAWTLVIVLSRQPGSLALVWFLTAALIMLLASGLVLWRENSRNVKIPITWIVVSAALLRLLSLLGDPLFEDDYYRYLWDGYQTATTNDPYTHAPAEFFDADVPEIFEPILSLINYPEVATVYGPVNQWLFALAYHIAPGEIWPLQLMAGIADLLVLCILFYLGSGNALLLYAWSPLLLKEFSLTAHPDIFAILGMMVSVYALYKCRALLAGIALALAFGTKVFAVLVLPYLLTSGGSFRRKGLLLLSSVGTLALTTAIFGNFSIWVPEGLRAMAGNWLFNAPIYLLLLHWLEFQSIKIILLSALLLFIIIVFCKRLWRERPSEDPVTLSAPSTPWPQTPAAFRGDWLFGLFLLAVPVLNPWYLAWALPFAVLWPRVWLWVASYTILLSYWYGSNVLATGPLSQQLPLGVVVIEYALIIIAPLLVFFFHRFTANAAKQPRN